MILDFYGYQHISDSDKLELVKSIRNAEYTEELIQEALKNKGGDLWKELQFLLFSMNTRLMDDGFGLGSARSKLDWDLRNTIERIEQQMQPQEKVPEELKDPEEFLTWLKIRISQHRVNQHQLFDYFDDDDLSDEELRYFLANYRINMQRFHLHVAAYSLFVPFKMREELYDNLYDEFGQGNFEEAHPNLFEPLMDHFGGAKAEDCNPETAHLLNTKMNLCWFADGLESGLGGMGALELSIPAQQKHILAHLRRKGLSEELVKFFVIHCELDEEHGDGWFDAGMPYIKTQDQFQKTFTSAMRMLEARAGVYDGVLSGIIERRNMPLVRSATDAPAAMLAENH